MDNKIRTVADVERKWDLPVLGVLPDELFNPEDALSTGPHEVNSVDNSYSYPYLPVLDWPPVEIRLKEPGGEGTVFLVSSAATGDGKTSVLARIVVRLGQAGFRTLAVDCDFQRPSLGDFFFANNRQAGLTDIIESITSVDISSGYLIDCSVSDLFLLIDQRKLTGKLSIMNEGQIIISTFKNGRLLSTEGAGSKKQNKLGSLLLEKELISTEQLDEALKKHVISGHPFGYVLLNSGYVSQDKLHQFLKVQTEENLQKLFSWKNGTFTFHSTTQLENDDEKIYFADNYERPIRKLAQMTESLLFDKKIKPMMTSTQHDNVDFLAAGSSAKYTNPRLLSALFEKIKVNYDFILLDGPPVLDAADATAFAQMTDGVIYVIKSGKLSSSVLQEALNRLASANSNILGIILNQVKTKDF